ncbi:MAG: protein kinase [Archangium sp.]
MADSPDDGLDRVLADLSRAPPVSPGSMPHARFGPDGVRLGPRPPVLNAGDVVGERFEVLGPLGRGAMGEVYRARDRKLERQVALKVLAATDEERRLRFEQEARAACAITHDNVLPVFDLGVHAGSPYLVLALFEGQTLRERLGNNGARVAEHTVQQWAIQLAEGLGAAHAAGVIHRDLKPENVLIAADERLRIVDFGLAKLRGAAIPDQSLTSDGAILGTVGYMSPEQARGEEVDARSDLFSAGTILLEALTGKAPFTRASPAESLSAILRDRPAELEQVPPAWKPILERCLARDRDERFQSARDLAFALRGIGKADRAAAKWWPLVAALCLAVAVAATFFALRAPATTSNAPPTFTRLTFQRGLLTGARYAPNGAVAYSAAWNGNVSRVFTTRPDAQTFRGLAVNDAELLDVGRDGTLLLKTGVTEQSIFGFWSIGRLSRASMEFEGIAREEIDGVSDADLGDDGSLAVIRAEKDVFRLEWPAGNVLVRATSWLAQPRISPDGTRLAFIDHPFTEDDGGRVVVIDRTGKQLAATGSFLSVEGVAWGPNAEVWFTGTTHGVTRELRALSLDGTSRLIQRAPGPLRLWDVDPLTGDALVSREDYRVSLYARDADGTQRDISWLDGSLLAGISADEATVYFFESFDGAGNDYALFARSFEGGPAVKLGEGASSSISPDGKQILVMQRAPTDGKRKLLVVPVGPGPTVELLPDVSQWSGVRWFPDGRRMLLLGGGHPQVLSTDDPKPQPVPIAITSSYHVVIFPGGRTVASLGTDRRVSLFDLESGLETPVPELPPGAVPVSIDSEGRVLTALERLHLPTRLLEVDLAAHTVRALPPIVPLDNAGITGIEAVGMSGDRWVYSSMQTLSTLYQVRGER